MPFRVGGSLGTAIYYVVGEEDSQQDVYLGIMTTPRLANMVAGYFNRAEKQTLEMCGAGEPNGFFPFVAHIPTTKQTPLYPAHLLPDEVSRRRQAREASLLRHPSRTSGKLPELHEEPETEE